MFSWLKSVRWWSLALFVTGVVLIHLSGAMHGRIPEWGEAVLTFLGVSCLALDWTKD